MLPRSSDTARITAASARRRAVFEVGSRAVANPSAASTVPCQVRRSLTLNSSPTSWRNRALRSSARNLLPLILRLWRGETTHERHAAAREHRDRAEVKADTAIVVKRAEVREAAEFMWAEQQLANARLAVEAQTEIDRAQHRRRVAEALEPPLRASSERVSAANDDNIYLPIAAEAEAASKAAMQVPHREIPRCPRVSDRHAR